MALQFEEHLYKLEESTPPTGGVVVWGYCFSRWPDVEVARRLVDYAAPPRPASPEGGLGKLAARIRGWVDGKGPGG